MVCQGSAATAAAKSTSDTETGLPNGIVYYCMVTKVNTAGNENPFSTEVSAEPTGSATGVSVGLASPTVPTQLIALLAAVAVMAAAGVFTLISRRGRRFRSPAHARSERSRQQMAVASDVRAVPDISGRTWWAAVTSDRSRPTRFASNLIPGCNHDDQGGAAMTTLDRALRPPPWICCSARTGRSRDLAGEILSPTATRLGRAWRISARRPGRLACRRRRTMVGLLKIDLIGMLVRGWREHRDIVSAARRTLAAPASTELVSMVRARGHAGATTLRQRRGGRSAGWPPSGSACPSSSTSTPCCSRSAAAGSSRSALVAAKSLPPWPFRASICSSGRFTSNSPVSSRGARNQASVRRRIPGPRIPTGRGHGQRTQGRRAPEQRTPGK